MKFSYKRYPNPNGIAIERPVILITLRNPRSPSSPGIRYEALVDSGSDRCIFSAEIGELLPVQLVHGSREPANRSLELHGSTVGAPCPGSGTPGVVS